MTERELQTQHGLIKIDREAPEPEWMRCTESQWEKKGDLSIRNGQMGEALKYADYANCVALYKEGFTVKQIQERFNHG